MKNLLLIAALLFSFALISCSDDDAPQAGVEQFEGTWSGTYDGNGDEGTWTVEVSQAGKVTGSATSTEFSMTFQLDGDVDSSGGFKATIGSASSGAEFNGQMTGDNASGTWVNGLFNGTWTGSKE